MTAAPYMSHAYLRQSEGVAFREFGETWEGIEALMPELIDTLFRLSYFAKQQEPQPEDGFAYFASERFMRAPYTLRSLWILAGAGYYFEATAIVRHMLETFVQLRYFAKHREKLVRHMTSVKSRERVQFKTMFDEFAPSYYENHYRVLANLSHGGVALSVLSGMEKATDASGQMLSPIGCKFSVDDSSFIVNHMLMITSGYLRHVPEWFTKYRTLVDADSENMRTRDVTRLDEWRKGQRASAPRSHGWHQLSGLLMGTS